MFNLYVGRLEQAREASKTAVMLGSYSPVRYSFETTYAMISTLLGDYRAAAFYGERALQRQPLFKPAKRYLIAAHALSGNDERARDLLGELRAAEPDLSLDKLCLHRLGLTRDADRDHIFAGYRQAGLR